MEDKITVELTRQELYGLAMLTSIWVEKVEDDIKKLDEKGKYSMSAMKSDELILFKGINKKLKGE